MSRLHICIPFSDLHVAVTYSPRYMPGVCLLLFPVGTAIGTSTPGYKTSAACCVFHVPSLKADSSSFQPAQYLLPDIKEVSRHKEMKLAFTCGSHKPYKIQLQELENN